MKTRPIELQRDGEDGPVTYTFSTNNTNLGNATGRIHPNITEVYVHDLEVGKQFRGKGIGSYCLKLIELDGAQLGLRTVSVFSYFHTRPFYARNGFKTAGAEGFMGVSMEKKINPVNTEKYLDKTKQSILNALRELGLYVDESKDQGKAAEVFASS